MLKHIVMWNFLDFAEGMTKEENLKTVKAKLENLRGIIPEIKFLEVGININKSDMAFDAALYSEFESEEALNIYQNHPKHREVSEFIAKIRTSRAVSDYYAD